MSGVPGLGSMSRFCEIIDAAEALDPSAFKPMCHVAYFSPEQELRQSVAMQKAASAIEARSDATPQSGAAEGESATRRETPK